MKIVVMDDTRSRRSQINEGLSRNRHDAILCMTSNEFMTTVQDSKYDMILMDLETWNKGKGIYNYFGIPKKLEKTPIIFYNAEEGFSSLADRSRHDKDQIIRKPSDAQVILDTVQQSM